MSRAQELQRRRRLTAEGTDWEYDARFDPDPVVAAKAIEAEREEKLAAKDKTKTKEKANAS